MNKPSVLFVTALLGAVSMPSGAQQPGAGGVVVAASSPGQGTIAQSVTVTATVTAVDAANRQVTLKGPRGNEVPMTVGPDVRNLEQVKVGDQVTARYIESLTLTLKKDGKELRGSSITSDAARAPKGGQPGGAAARQVEVTADVIAVDPKTQTLTLKGSMRTVELKVPDRGQFNLVKVGDQIQAVYTEALAVSVEPAAKK